MFKITHVEHDDNQNIYIREFGFQKKERDPSFGPRKRKSYVLHFVLSGKGFFGDTAVVKGQGFYSRPGDICEYHSSTPYGWDYFWIILEGNCVDDFIEKSLSPNNSGIFEFKQTDMLDLFVKTIFTETVILHYKALAYFFDVLNITGHKKTQNDTASKIKTYIDDNYRNGITVTEVANYFYISDRYLYNLFKRKFSVSPKRYIDNRKIFTACELLKNTNLPIKQIAEYLNFSDVFSFSHFFKIKMKVSPLAYKKTYDN